MKTIGVLGLGAQATVDFEMRIHREAQRLMPARATMSYPPMITYFHRRPPIVVNDDLSPVLPLRPDPALLEAAGWLAERADFLVMTANGPHMFRREVEQAAGRPVVSMIDATVAEVRRRGWRRVGVLVFFGPAAPIYSEPLAAHGIACELIDADRQSRLNDAIFRLMEGRETEASRSAVRDAVETLRGRGVEGIIPGCTELPLLLGADADAADLVNPAQLLAEAAVRAAMGE